MSTISIADKPTLDAIYEKVSHSGHYVGGKSASIPKYNLPYTFYQGCAVVYNDEIHILGGASGVDISALYYHYKWDGVQWEHVSTLPFPFINGCAVVLDGEIHIIGSSNDSTCYKYHYKWDGTAWVSVSTLKYNFYNGSAVVYDGQIHILGSSNASTVYKYHYIFYNNIFYHR